MSFVLEDMGSVVSLDAVRLTRARERRAGADRVRSTFYFDLADPGTYLAVDGYGGPTGREHRARVFEGLTGEEIAARLQCAPATIARDWSFAKRWLQRELLSIDELREAIDEMSRLDFMREAPLALPMETAL